MAGLRKQAMANIRASRAASAGGRSHLAAAQASALISAAERELSRDDLAAAVVDGWAKLAHARAEFVAGNYEQAGREARELVNELMGTGEPKP